MMMRGLVEEVGKDKIGDIFQDKDDLSFTYLCPVF
jgi:hypothetical protein